MAGAPALTPRSPMESLMQRAGELNSRENTWHPYSSVSFRVHRCVSTQHQQVPSPCVKPWSEKVLCCCLSNSQGLLGPHTGLVRPWWVSSASSSTSSPPAEFSCRLEPGRAASITHSPQWLIWLSQQLAWKTSYSPKHYLEGQTRDHSSQNLPP